MPHTLLIQTDFSVNSKSGIRFALQLAKQAGISLAFYHCIPYLKPTRWSDARYDAYVTEEKEGARKRMVSFIHASYQNAGRRKSGIEYIMLMASRFTTMITPRTSRRQEKSLKKL
jgi:hypothetical protein